MGRTRGKGEGSIYQRADGYWVGQIEAGRCPGGHPKRSGETCAGGERRYRRIVRRYRQDVVAQIGKMSGRAGRRMKVDAFFDFWLTEVIAGDVAASSLDEYTKRLARCRPSIGHLWLDKLGDGDIQLLANQLTDRYAPKTRSTTLSTLKAALDWGVPGYIPRNPAEHVKPPKRKAVKVDDTLEADEATAVLDAAVGDRYEALYWLALKYGLRIGELLALDWDDSFDVQDWDADIDDGDEMSVIDAKTESGVRTMPLIAEAKRKLASHRARTLAAGRPLTGPVFVGPEGGKLKAQRVRGWYSDLLGRVGVKHKCRTCNNPDKACSSNVRRFHTTRHTAATLLLEAGVPLEVVSKILGHANIGITADLYAKVRDDLVRRGLRQVG